MAGIAAIAAMARIVVIGAMALMQVMLAMAVTEKEAAVTRAIVATTVAGGAGSRKGRDRGRASRKGRASRVRDNHVIRGVNSNGAQRRAALAARTSSASRTVREDHISA